MNIGEAHAFSSDGKVAIEKSAETNKSVAILPSDFDFYFEITETSEWIKQNNFKTVHICFYVFIYYLIYTICR